MLIKHVFYYLFARGLPGLINFAALAVYTRLLGAEDFGRYSLVLTGAGLIQVIVFQSLLLVLGRFLPAHQANPKIVLQPVLCLFLALATGVMTLGLGLVLLGVSELWRNLILLTLILSIAQAWHELNLRLAAARLDPGSYGLMGGVKALLALGFGSWLAWLGWGAHAPILGLITGAVLSWFFFGYQPWRGIKPRWPAPDVLKQYGAYGLPLAMTFLLVWVTSSSDRLMIAWLLDEAATGLYSVGYDLAQHSLGLLLTILNTAALPLAIRALESEGLRAASEQMRHNGELIFIAALGGGAGLIAIGPIMLTLFVGVDFRAGAGTVFPWIAVAAALVGIKSFHFDIAFHLTKKSGWLILTSGVAALVNVIANLVLIPRFGILGAAWSTLVALLVATVGSAVIGQKVFPMPPFLPLVTKGGLMALGVYVSTYAAIETVVSNLSVFFTLIWALLAGTTAAGLTVCALDLFGIRGAILAEARKLWQMTKR